MTTQDLFDECHYHRICGNLVTPGETVCHTCRTEFGQLLRHQSAEPRCGDAITQTKVHLDPADHASAEKRRRQADGSEEKPSQQCWLCEQTRVCLLVDRRWECRHCRTIK
ncbi:hypothetical protein [Aldersonia kunmingensis]|uniref:hypothetical protein n=1 Tax=Aldersonia kunmingensis TaxID=408066 RepID=UPI00082A02D4|nr:hypothetical protein [Aldersonia kunmingensis]